jgi:hypothetical protein
LDYGQSQQWNVVDAKRELAMRKRKDRRGIEIFSLSFLDIVACAFGAIVLLLLITKSAGVATDSGDAVDQQMAALFSSMDEAEALQAQIASLQGALSKQNAELETTQSLLSSASDAQTQAQSRQNITAKVVNDMRVARQSLTEEMRRMLDKSEQDDEVGGIPVDSEYVIFVVDTSGSMQQIWPQVMREISNVLDIHPTVRGFQIMNDQGQYLFDGYRREWMADTPTLRRGALDLMGSWTAFSNSDPVQGIRAAIQTFYDPEKKISIFVFGDEFNGDSVEQTVRMIDEINKPDASGERRVQIHAIGFLSEYTLMTGTGGRFAHLMREVTRRNNGAFVALSN